MGNHDRSRWTTRAAAASLSFMCMVPTASAFRLSDFMLITSTQVPLGCILAYNNQISGCTARDFTKGSAGCSTACVDGINRIQYTLQAVCGDVSEPATTILGQALLGNLVEVLCPAASAGTTTTSESTTLTRLTLTTVVPPRTTTTDRPTPSSSAPTTTETTSTSSSTSTAPTPLASDIPDTAPPPAFSPGPPIDSTTGTSQPTGSTTTEPPRSTKTAIVGAGSLFDEPIRSSAQLRVDSPHWLTAPVSLFAIAFDVMILW